MEIFPEYKKMSIQNINDKNDKVILTRADKVDDKVATLISYNPDDFDISEAKKFVKEKEGFAWGSTINIDFDKAPGLFWCYIHEKGTDEIKYRGKVDKFRCRSSKVPKIWKELQKHRDDHNDVNPAKKFLFFTELDELRKPIEIKEFRKYKDNSPVDVAALRNFVWVKPI